jgi:hypothetical protein
MNRGGMRSQHRPAPSGQLPHSSNSWPFLMVSFDSIITSTLSCSADRCTHTGWRLDLNHLPNHPPAQPSAVSRRLSHPHSLNSQLNITPGRDATHRYIPPAWTEELPDQTSSSSSPPPPPPPQTDPAGKEPFELILRGSISEEDRSGPGISPMPKVPDQAEVSTARTTFILPCV